jgi:hypothetical protein
MIPFTTPLSSILKINSSMPTLPYTCPSTVTHVMQDEVKGPFPAVDSEGGIKARNDI